MSTSPGYLGQFIFGGGAVLGVEKWDFEEKADLQEVSQMSTTATGFKDYAANLIEGTVSVDGNLDASDAKWKGSPPAIRAGAKGAGSVTTGEGKVYSGTLIVESYKISNQKGQQVSYSISAKFCGSITRPTS